MDKIREFIGIEFTKLRLCLGNALSQYEIADDTVGFINNYFEKSEERLIEKLSITPPLTEWISVKDRLPEESELYIILADNIPYIARFYPNRTIKDEIWGSKYDWHKPTHWMPIPPPPVDYEVKR